jgi:epoxyqueuosine reductase
MSPAQKIKQKALELGFDAVGITDANPISSEQVELLAGWLKCGFAGEMGYMHRNFEKRVNPAKLLENAKSVICVGLNYTRPKYSLPSPGSTVGRVAQYAQYEDYHPFIKRQLRHLADFITSLVNRDLRFKICVDSAPLAERALAARAGLGFIGKNHMLISPEFGPQVFLGEIITDLKLQGDGPITNNCADCNKCIRSCPTGALREDGGFDANKCISYLTIEHKVGIPAELSAKIGHWLFGCDECVLACPWLENVPLCRNKDFKFYSDRALPDLCRILNMTEKQFRSEFADSCLNRAGLERLQANAQIVLKNITG